MLKTLEKSDLQLREDVETELVEDPSLNAAKIGVAVTEGVVTLAGQVSTYWQKTNAERDAVRIQGVRGIVNEIEVHVAGDHTDPNIAMAAVAALQRNSQVPRDVVTVKVAGGWVTLSGKVTYEFQRRAAERTVRDLHGVKGVVNIIEIKPLVYVADVREKIEKSFERQALVDARNVAVSVRGDKVHLRGSVRSWAERREAENAAAGTPGVAAVDNEIVVRF